MCDSGEIPREEGMSSILDLQPNQATFFPQIFLPASLKLLELSHCRAAIVVNTIAQICRWVSHRQAEHFIDPSVFLPGQLQRTERKCNVQHAPLKNNLAANGG